MMCCFKKNCQAQCFITDRAFSTSPVIKSISLKGLLWAASIFSFFHVKKTEPLQGGGQVFCNHKATLGEQRGSDMPGFQVCGNINVLS